MTTLADDIQATRDYIAEHGWCQHGYRDDDGRACLRGAAWGVLTSSQRIIAVRKFLGTQIKQMGLDWEWGKNGVGEDMVVDGDGLAGFKEPVALYNDTVLKTQAEALQFLDKARIAAEEKVR